MMRRSVNVVGCFVTHGDDWRFEFEDPALLEDREALLGEVQHLELQVIVGEEFGRQLRSRDR